MNADDHLQSTKGHGEAIDPRASPLAEEYEQRAAARRSRHAAFPARKRWPSLEAVRRQVLLIVHDEAPTASGERFGDAVILGPRRSEGAPGARAANRSP
jgi:hypothetical protein